MQHHRFVWALCATVAAFAAISIQATSANADVIDTFDNNVNLGAWRLTTNPNMLYQIEANGGNPGAYLHGQVSTAVPTWYISNTVGNPFIGDYAAQGVTSFSFNMTISGGIQVPDRNMTLHLFTTLGTGDLSLGIEAYSIGTDISQFPIGWANYSYAIDATSATIPNGWVVFEGNGDPGTDADWHSLMTHIENVTMDLGTPGFFYPNLGVWDLGLDNVTLTMVPAPGTGAVVLLSIITLPGRRRR
jgi:hypothetical protein